MVSPSLKRRMCSWQVVAPASGPCGTPLITQPHAPQMPSRQSESNAMASSPLRMRSSLTTSSISRNDMSVEMSVRHVVDHAARLILRRLPPDFQFHGDRLRTHSFVHRPHRPCITARR